MTSGVKLYVVSLSLALLSACSSQASLPEVAKASASSPVNEIRAELLASDKSWGNTEGVQPDSRNNLFFCSRGAFKGIVKWDGKNAEQWLAIAPKEGPGGLWIDDSDNIYLTATGERQIQKVTPDKKVSIVAKDFEADKKLPTGPNDLVVARNGTIYFTDPNGFRGEAPNGTVYKISNGKTSVFTDGFTGPNGIALSQDEKTLYVSHNTAATTSKIESFAVNADGSAGPMVELATVPNCVADGVAVDRIGSVWLTCYSFGTAYRIGKDGHIQEKVTTEQTALTNCKFGRGSQSNFLFLTSSDMERVTGYIYRARVTEPGLR